MVPQNGDISTLMQLLLSQFMQVLPGVQCALPGTKVEFSNHKPLGTFSPTSVVLGLQSTECPPLPPPPAL